MFSFYPKDIIKEITQARIINISGKLGSGKTILSVAIAIQLWKMGLVDDIITTFPLGGRTLDTSKVKDRFIVLADELGKLQDARNYAKNDPEKFIVDLRKIDAFFISSSKRPVDKRFRDLRIERIRPSYGNKAWHYYYETEEGNQIIPGKFWLINPSYIFGMYPTKFRVGIEDFKPLAKIMENVNPNEQIDYIEKDNQWVMDGMKQFIMETGESFYGKTVYKPKTIFGEMGKIIRGKKKK